MQKTRRIAENADSMKGLSARISPHWLKDGDSERIKHSKVPGNVKKYHRQQIF